LPRMESSMRRALNRVVAAAPEGAKRVRISVVKPEAFRTIAGSRSEKAL
jgi:hypothetical protein